MALSEAKTRLMALRKLLEDGKLSTQEELAEELARQNFEVTQSTISRDLRRVGAIKVVDPTGNTVYKLGATGPAVAPVVAGGLKNHIVNIKNNESMIIIHTTIGSASLLAKHLDQIAIKEIIGTIAGDDTIFVAPASTSKIPTVIKKIQDSL
jgi:transcriptional regulator of arginine metabolism